MTARHAIAFGTVYAPNATGCDADQILYVLDRLCEARDDQETASQAANALERLRNTAWDILQEMDNG